MIDFYPFYLIYFAIFLQLIGMIMVAVIDPYINSRQRLIVLANCLLIFVLVVQNYLDYFFGLDDSKIMQRIITSIVGYSVRPIIIMLWISLIKKKQSIKWGWGLVILNVLVHMTVIFSDICFNIKPSNEFHRGPLGYTCHIVSAVLLLYLYWMSADMYIDSVGKKMADNNSSGTGDYSGNMSGEGMKKELIKYGYGIEGLVPIWNVLIIIVSVVLDTKDLYYGPLVFLTTAIVSCNTFYYIWLHLGFVRERVEESKAKQRIQIMKSQIQPHFMYNALSTIQALCLTDPKLAADTAERFGTYLRQNIDSLDQSDLISLKQEIEHTKVYASIEQIRFPSIDIEYDVDETKLSGLDLPALTIQPLVENAIRHGVRSKEHGVVKVSAHRKEKFYEIIVEDNGVGFDTKVLQAQSGEHIGIKNVTERIESLCDGTLEVKSTPNEGTCVTIHIPFDV